MTAAAGKPGDLHPRIAAQQLGLPVRSGQVTWAQLLDAAIDSYWTRRPRSGRWQRAAGAA